LHHYDNCNLGSVNLAVFYDQKTKGVAWSRLRAVTKASVRMLDNVIDTFAFPVQKVTDLAQKNRRVGLGIMGFADLLYQLGIPYNSAEGQKMGEKLMKTITDTAHQMSEQLAKEKGAFPNLPFSVYAKKKLKLRNAALTTVAPTGSIAMMLDTSSGIEPNFAIAYVKQDKDGHQYHYVNRHFEAALKKHRVSEEKIKEIKEEVVRTGTIQGLSGIPEELRRTFVVAMDVSAEDHMKMQAAFQRNVDNSISKTINFPNSATKEDVTAGYITAWRLKCKSATVYRDGSREVQILNIGTGEGLRAPSELGKGGLVAQPHVTEPSLDLPIDRNRIDKLDRPEVMAGRTYRVKTGYGRLYVTINNDASSVPFEIFATLGKSGGFFQEQSEAICRMISLALRSGVKVEEIITQLKGIRGPMPTLTNKGTILSLPDAIGQLLEEHVRATGGDGATPLLTAEPAEMVAVKAETSEKTSPKQQKKQIADYGTIPGCPDCGGSLTLQEGCMSCKSCGFSRCG
jgi:ribonucleoside-diphosphate reductase alpha chain